MAAALSEDRHVGQIYEVTGPRLLTFADAVGEIAKATGRQIRYVAVSPEEFASALTDAGLPTDEVTAYTELFTQVLDGRKRLPHRRRPACVGPGTRDFADYAWETAATGFWRG